MYGVYTDDDDPSKPLQSGQLTRLQERLLKKLGPNAYPFYFEVSSYDRLSFCLGAGTLCMHQLAVF